jgi:hypothetical protein
VQVYYYYRRWACRWAQPWHLGWCLHGKLELILCKVLVLEYSSTMKQSQNEW